MTTCCDDIMWTRTLSTTISLSAPFAPPLLLLSAESPPDMGRILLAVRGRPMGLDCHRLAGCGAVVLWAAHLAAATDRSSSVGGRCDRVRPTPQGWKAPRSDR